MVYAKEGVHLHLNSPEWPKKKRFNLLWLRDLFILYKNYKDSQLYTQIVLHSEIFYHTSKATASPSHSTFCLRVVLSLLRKNERMHCADIVLVLIICLVYILNHTHLKKNNKTNNF